MSWWDETKSAIFDIGTSWGSKILAALAIAVVGWLIARFAGGRVRALAERSGKVDRTFISVLSKIARFSVLAAVVVAVLGQLGVDTASLLAFLGAAGLAIGLALKDTASDVAGGIVLLLLRPFSVDDSVMINTTSGVVDEIGIFQTALTTFEGVPVVIPNSKVRTSEIQNFTRAGRRRIELTIGVAYATDLDRAIAVLRDVMANEERVLADPAPLIDVSALGPSSVDILVRVWTRPESFMDTKLALSRLVKQRFDAEGIEIPFPQRVVHTIPAAK